jgi:hypothetical protein
MQILLIIVHNREEHHLSLYEIGKLSLLAGEDMLVETSEAPFRFPQYA